MQQITVSEFLKLPLEIREQRLNSLSDQEFLSLRYDWEFWARPNQLEPAELKDSLREEFLWIILAGRGFGKTRIGSEWVIDNLQNHGYRRLNLCGAAADEVRDIMIEGESGILACSPPWFYPVYEPSKKKLTWPNGAIANIYYGSEPEKSRGSQCDILWIDEMAKHKYPEETYDNLILGLRLGNNPIGCVTTTPKPTKFIKRLVNESTSIVTTGNTYENIDNLAKPFVKTIIQKYEGTRLGRQELHAAILDDNPRALWKRLWLDKFRVTKSPKCYKMVVAVDPPAADPEESKNPDGIAEAGIIVVGEGKAMPGMDHQDKNHYYVFEDLSLQGSPNIWAGQAIAGYHKYSADSIVPEKNNGGAMVKSTINNIDDRVPIHPVWASRGKHTRAEPVSTLYEQGRVHHVGTFNELEDQLCEWVPGDKSPDRLDAVVWGISYLAGFDIKVPAPSAIKQRSRGRSRVSNLPT